MALNGNLKLIQLKASRQIRKCMKNLFSSLMSPFTKGNFNRPWILQLALITMPSFFVFTGSFANAMPCADAVNRNNKTVDFKLQSSTSNFSENQKKFEFEPTQGQIGIDPRISGLKVELEKGDRDSWKLKIRSQPTESSTPFEISLTELGGKLGKKDQALLHEFLSDLDNTQKPTDLSAHFVHEMPLAAMEANSSMVSHGHIWLFNSKTGGLLKIHLSRDGTLKGGSSSSTEVSTERIEGGEGLATFSLGEWSLASPIKTQFLAESIIGEKDSASEFSLSVAQAPPSLKAMRRGAKGESNSFAEILTVKRSGESNTPKVFLISDGVALGRALPSQERWSHFEIFEVPGKNGVSLWVLDRNGHIHFHAEHPNLQKFDSIEIKKVSGSSSEHSKHTETGSSREETPDTWFYELNGNLYILNGESTFVFTSGSGFSSRQMENVSLKDQLLNYDISMKRTQNASSKMGKIKNFIVPFWLTKLFAQFRGKYRGHWEISQIESSLSENGSYILKVSASPKNGKTATTSEYVFEFEGQSLPSGIGRSNIHFKLNKVEDVSANRRTEDAEIISDGDGSAS